MDLSRDETLRLTGSRAVFGQRSKTRQAYRAITARQQLVSEQLVSPKYYASPPTVQVAVSPPKHCQRVRMHSEADRVTPELSSLMNSKVVQEYLLSAQADPGPQPVKAFPDINRLTRKPDVMHCRSQQCRADFQKKMRWLCSIRSQSFDNSGVMTVAQSRRRILTKANRSPPKQPDACDGIFNDREMRKKIKVMRIEACKSFMCL